MDPTTPQDTGTAPGLSEESQVSIDELRYHLEGLRSLFVFALLALIAMTLTVDLCFIRRQMLSVRAQLEDQRPRVSEKVATFKKNEPLARTFAVALQNFTNSNPDFQPTLERHRGLLLTLMNSAPSPAMAPSPPKAPPGLPK